VRETVTGGGRGIEREGARGIERGNDRERKREGIEGERDGLRGREKEGRDRGREREGARGKDRLRERGKGKREG